MPPIPGTGRRGVVATGPPGLAWVNDTGKHLWQLFAVVHPGYGYCFQSHTHVGHYWPLPHTEECTCHQKVVKAGDTAEPFADLGAELAKLGPAEQDALIGRDNWMLFRSGVVGWSDIVALGRIREFLEVVDSRDLAVEDLMRAGFTEADARDAWGAVHTPERRALDAQRRELVADLKAAGLTEDQIVEAIVGKIVGGIGGSGSGPSS